MAPQAARRLKTPMRPRRKAQPVPFPAATSSRPTRVLILSADVGEGHAAAARALAQQIHNGDDPAEVEIVDGLAGMGRLLRYVVEDGYRTQLRYVPWSYSIIYWMLEHLAPVRWVISSLLTLLGSRPLLRQIKAHDPDVVVSTYPAVTVVLAHLRRLGHVTCPTIATITDLTGLFFWARPGIDTHLVMYGESIESVERIAGRDSVRLVSPLISEEFLDPCDRREARLALGLPETSRVVIVSGGGWGVGDIKGAVRELLHVPDATVVCLAGRNEQAERGLNAAFADEPRVRVLGFTSEMSRLLAAADALVHSTGGVTCLEAMARGCPVVSYGLPVGHARVNTAAMAELDLLRLANSRGELVEQVESCFVERDAAVAAHAASERAVDVVLDAPARVRPVPRWRPVATRFAAQAMVVLSGATWMLSTDDLTAFAARLMGAQPIKRVSTHERSVALIVRTSPGEVGLLATRLAGDGLKASFAFSSVPSAATIDSLRISGDECMPELSHGGLLHWTRTRAALHAEARAMSLSRRFYYLAPSSPVMGQLLLARTVGSARAVAGSVRLDSRTPSPHGALRAGDVVVVTVDGSPGSLRSLDALASTLSADGLGSSPLSALASPAIRAASSGERASDQAPATSTARDVTSPTDRATPPANSLSWTSTGASATGTIV
jgi:processive 1,2-diacylglycerol beta-glucosyltransferase